MGTRLRVIDATTRTIFLADAARYATFLLLPVPSLSYAAVSNSLGVTINVVVGDEKRERNLVFLLALALGPRGAPVGGDTVLHGMRLLKGLVKLFILRAFVSAVAVVGVEGGPGSVVLGLGVRL